MALQSLSKLLKVNNFIQDKGLVNFLNKEKEKKLISVALPKGRIAKEILKFFEKAGFDLNQIDLNSRKLIFKLPKQNLTIVLLRNTDVGTFVEHGICDIGFLGYDLIQDLKPNVYELLDLDIAKCKMVLAGLPNTQINSLKPVKVASKFENIAKNYLIQNGFSFEVIKLYGNIELGPILGISDFVVDLVSSGQTLKENGLVVYKEIMDISTYLIANKSKYKTKNKEIQSLVENFRKLV